MNLTKRGALLVLTSAVLALGLCSCSKDGRSPGEKIDRALDRTGEAVKDAGEAIKVNK